jgi:hypothetical protein
VRLAYIAGPYRGKNEYEVYQNIERAGQMALKYWKLGYAVICPHKNTAFFTGAEGLPDSTWLDGDLEMLGRCDVIVMLPGWELSQGAYEELKFARAHELQVIFEDSVCAKTTTSDQG